MSFELRALILSREIGPVHGESRLHAYSAPYSLTAKPGCSGFERAIFESRPSAWPNPSIGAAAVSSPQLRDGQQLGDRARVAACCRRCGSRQALARGATTIEPSTASSCNDGDAMLEKHPSCLFGGNRPAKNTPFLSWCGSLRGNDIGDKGAIALAAILNETMITNLRWPSNTL